MKEIINSMSTFELGFNVTITGVALVFAMLLLLVLVLVIFGAVSVALQKNGDKKRNKEKEAMLMAMADESKDEPDDAEVSDCDDNLSEEVVAAISAAIATLYSGTSKKPVIKAIKKSGSRRSAWANAGIVNNTRTF